jgi:uncharacterized protein
MLFDAIRHGDAGQVRALLTADPSLHDARTPEGATPVQWAVYTQHPELAPILLGTRAPDFFEACALGRTERVADLLDADPSLVNAHSPDGFTGLGFACFFRHPALAVLLLDRGAEPSLAARNALGVAPLHSAVASKVTELVELLLSRGANPNARDSSGMTPLHTAAGHGDRILLDLLLARGADPKAQAKDGTTPADVARRYGHSEVAHSLESAAW